MFGRKKDETEERQQNPAVRENARRSQPAGAQSVVPRISQPRFHPDIPHLRPPEPAPAQRSEPRDLSPTAESKRLTVGKDIALSGDITSCDKLVVEGRVEANLHDARELQILRPGRFSGTATVEEADIAGEFSGKLVVTGRLTVRSGGRIEGELSYGILKVEEGGQIAGSIAVDRDAARIGQLKPVDGGAGHGGNAAE